MPVGISIILAVGFLAYANGANDNFKGVASLFGSGTAGYRIALSWATLTTCAGSLAAVFLAGALLARFSGKGLVPAALVASPEFVLAVAGGAGATVIFATRFGFPVSTTHSLTGALVGAGWAAVGAEVDLAVLGRAFVLPLLLSPLLAFATGAVVYAVARRARLRWGGREKTGGRTGRWLDAAHFASAGAVSFARGLNDTPKIAALLLVAGVFEVRWVLVGVAGAMAAGGLLHARRVAETMSHRITGLNAGQGFAANLSTAVLVITASGHGLPVSTTHVSVGALLGIGVTAGRAKWKPVLGVLASWVVTLPCAATMAGLAYAIAA